MDSANPPPAPAPVPPDLLFLHPCSPHEPSFFSGSISRSLNPETSPISPSPTVTPVETNIVSSSNPKSTPELWVSKFKSSFLNLSKVDSPSLSEDGIPIVKAPASITLGSSHLWKNHLVAYFHGTPPSPAKIFTDLNPIWGKQGRISIKQHSKSVCLIYIPCEVTRKWVLDVGFWHSGNCSFTVTLWSPSINLAPMKLVHAPIWVLFKQVPPELWSLDGFSTIASGVGFPVHSESSTLKPYSNGVVKLKVVVELAKKRPSLVRVTDRFGNTALVSAEYPQLPPRCSLCGEFGHLGLRCPEVVMPPVCADIRVGSVCPGLPATTVSNLVTTSKQAVSGSSPARDVSSPPARVASASPPTRDASSPPVSTRLSSPSPVTLPLVHRSGLQRSVSLPSCQEEDSDGTSSNGWIRVAHRTKPPKPDLVAQSSVHHVTSSQFRNEEDIILLAQQVIRNRLASPANEALPSRSLSTKRKARKKQRNKLYLLSSGSESASSVAFPSQLSVSAPPSPSRGQTQSRFVPLLKA